jgi:hypothetical protein
MVQARTLAISSLTGQQHELLHHQAGHHPSALVVMVVMMLVRQQHLSVLVGPQRSSSS